MFGHSYGGDSVPLSAALIVNARTGGILYSNNIDAKTQPASIAKMMTLLIAFQQLKQKIIRLDSMIKISANAASQAPCRLGLKCGDSISVHDAILAMVTKSANDVSVALAEHLAGGSLPRFVDMMNTEAKRLRMTSTRFLNPSGWKDPQQLTTARDIAKLSRALLVEYPSYYRFFSTKSFAFKKHIYKNHNTLLGAKDGIVVDGIKTGFINASGYNTAVSAKKGRDRLIAVFFGGKSARQRDQAVALLLKAGFEKLSARRKAILIAKCTPKSSATHNLLQAHGKLMAAKTTKDHATDRRRFFEDIARRKNILQSKSASTKIHAKAIISDQHDVKSQRISEK
jgi:D-alanyl-D-alanine carboxypeptidase